MPFFWVPKKCKSEKFLLKIFNRTEEDQDLLRLLLECIFIWSKWFTADNELEEML